MRTQVSSAWTGDGCKWHPIHRTRRFAQYVYNGEVVATAIVNTDNLIEAFKVKEGCCRQGHGTQFMQELLDYFGDCHLEVLRGNEAAISLYEKAGFRFLCDEDAENPYYVRAMKTQGYIEMQATRQFTWIKSREGYNWRIMLLELRQ